MKDLYTEFVHKLKKLYGKFDAEHKRFEKASNSEIARELGYSDAQFSRLINKSATEGEYVRSNQNADRILALIEMEAKLKEVGSDALARPGRMKYLYLLVGLVVGLLGYYLITSLAEESITQNKDSDKYEMLKWSFETSFINPYINLKDLPEDCNFPCYKYQGKWELDHEYKIPFFRERNGFHYLATEVQMYARCMTETSPLGETLEGYEYQKHEIWYDISERPIDSLLENETLSSDYREMNFNDNSDFIKVAYVHTFFRNEFSLDSAQIIRTGKVIGRDIEFVNDELLVKKLGSKDAAKDILSEVNSIIINRLEDFSKPISCGLAEVPNFDFHEIKDNDFMSFDCQLTTGRVSLGYNKVYRLTDQYIKNKCRAE